MKARHFSRNLPPAPSHSMTPAGWLFLACLVVGFGAALISIWPFPVLGLLAIATFAGWVDSRSEASRLRALALSRPGDPLCAFARSMDLRAVDPWVVRAAFEELQPYFPKQARPFPLRPEDRLVADLRIDPDDIDDIAQSIATRAGYSLDQSEQNPLYGRVESVENLIQFFSHQPKTRTA